MNDVQNSRGSEFDYNALLNPPWQPSRRSGRAIDVLSWALPVCAALASIGGGIGALHGADRLAAYLGIFGGVSGAAGVIFTGLASRMRDGRLAVAHAIGALALGGVDRHDRQSTGIGG